MADADVIVAGAGPAGIMTALLLARNGWRAVVLERKPRAKVGRPIRVALEEKIFEDNDLPAPEPPELLKQPQARELLSPDGRHKLKIRSLPVVGVDLRLLAQRLVETAEAQGVQFFFNTTVTGPVVSEGRVTGVIGTTGDGRLLELSAPLTVDASGIYGVLRHELPEELGIQREIDPADVCNLWQESREINRSAVMDLLAKNRIRPQVNVLRAGFMGPYSLFGVYVDLECDCVEVTVGVAHDERYPTAKELAQRYLDSHHWIGEPIVAGGGLVPVRRPLDSMVASGFAVVGDAACQAIPQFAGGISSGLAAARMLAETAGEALQKNDPSRAALWPYNVRYQRSRGAAAANSDLFRRFLLTTSADELSAVFARGIVTVEGIAGVMEGMPLELPKSAVLSSALGLLGRPNLLRKLWRLTKDPLRVLDLYQEYPETDDDRELDRWRREVDKIFKRW
jgi:flavin-dependent dehydrogenase